MHIIVLTVGFVLGKVGEVYAAVMGVVPSELALGVARHTSHVTRHTSHVTRHTSHVTRHLKGSRSSTDALKDLQSLSPAC
jgi:hypothetical protein